MEGISVFTCVLVAVVQPRALTGGGNRGILLP